MGFPDQSLERIEEALTRARELSEPHGLAHAALFASVLYQLRRDALMAQYYAEAVIDISREHGLALYGAMAMIVQAWSLSKYRDTREAVDQIREGLAALLQQEHSSFVRIFWHCWSKPYRNSTKSTRHCFCLTKRWNW
jgi:hypothetical protein